MTFDPNPLFYAMASIVSENYFKAEDKRCLRIRNEGGSRCFAASQEVQTPNGPAPIAELRPGDLVLTLNEQTHKDEFKPVQEVHRFENTKRTIRVKLKSGAVIECTEDHEFYKDGSWYSLKHLLTLKEKSK